MMPTAPCSAVKWEGTQNSHAPVVACSTFIGHIRSSMSQLKHRTHSLISPSNMNRRGENHSAISLCLGALGQMLGGHLPSPIPLSYLLPLRAVAVTFLELPPTLPGPSQNLRRPGGEGLAHHTKDHSQAPPEEALSNQADHCLLLQAYLTMLPTDLIRLRPVS